MMDVATSCLVVFQVSVFILPMDKIDGQPLYEHPREYPLKASEANSCYQQIYGEEMKSAGKKYCLIEQYIIVSSTINFA